MKLQIGHLTHAGAQRFINQDSLGTGQGVPAASLAQRGHLFAVADGFGRDQAGHAASATAIRVLTQAYYTSRERDTGTALVRAVQEANKTVHKEIAGRQAGTTLTAAVVRGNTLHVAHIGDSRAYLLRGGQLRRLTHDHTWAAEQVRRGRLTPAQTAQHPRRNQLSRALGIQPELERDAIEHVAETLRPGDTLLLCTDGLTDLIDDNELAPVLAGHVPGAVAQQLVNLAGRRGGPDDVTVVVARMRSKSIPVNVWAPLVAIGGALVLTLLVALIYPSAQPAPTALPGSVAPVAGQTQAWTPPPLSVTPEVTSVQPEASQPGLKPTSTLAPTSPAIAPAPSPTSGPGAGTPSAATASPAYGAPQLLAPGDQAEFRGPDAEIRLQWTSVGELGPDDYYVVITNFPHEDKTWHDWQQTKDTELVVPRYLYDKITGVARRVEWRVAVWRKPQLVGDKMVGTPVSPESEGRVYVWAVPAGGTVGPTTTPEFEG